MTPSKNVPKSAAVEGVGRGKGRHNSVVKAITSISHPYLPPMFIRKCSSCAGEARRGRDRFSYGEEKVKWSRHHVETSVGDALAQDAQPSLLSARQKSWNRKMRGEVRCFGGKDIVVPYGEPVPCLYPCPWRSFGLFLTFVMLNQLVHLNILLRPIIVSFSSFSDAALYCD